MIIRGTRRWTPTALVVAVVAALATAAFTAPADAASGPRVQGVVIAADGSGPIAGIEVCAFDSKGETCAETATGGNYSIQLSKGTFRVYAQERFLYGTWVKQDYQAGKKFTFKSTTSLTADFALVRGARISGHITPPDGEPAMDVGSIRAYRVDAAGKTASSGDYFSNLASDGYFSIAKLPAGAYKLQIEPSRTYTNQWYPAASSANAAEPITVGAGQTVGGRDIKLTPPGSITLHLLKPDGSPADDSMLLFDADGREVHTSFDGYHSTRTFTGLHPGTYKVLASPIYIAGYEEWFGGAATFAKGSAINVVSGETAERTMTFHYETLKTTKRPALTYKHYALTTTKGTWSPAKPKSYRYEWYRDDKLIVPEGFDSYIPKRADIGHKIAVCITADRSGYAPGRSCSKPSAKIKKV